MNPNLSKLQPYPFEKLMLLKQGCAPPKDLHAIALSIGEPKQETPDFIAQTLTENLASLANYPVTRGTEALRQAIVTWLMDRFKLPENSLSAERNVIPVNGTREALFALAQAVVDPTEQPYVLMPNPFYQIYEGAAILAGAQPIYINATEASHYLPDFENVSTATWRKCQLLYICSPANPTGAVLSSAALCRLIELAEKHDFIIASDECYSEIYLDEQQPPEGLLGAAAAMGNHTYQRCIVFHSLSKRSNAPGLRSGFVAGDAEIIKQFLLYRTYHGCAMPPPVQAASVKAWQDEHHVQQNRRLYREKFDAVLRILDGVLPVAKPSAGFYLWPQTPLDDQAFAKALYHTQHVTVLPGSFLSRDSDGVNPGQQHVRMALVAPIEDCIIAAERIKKYVSSLT